MPRLPLVLLLLSLATPATAAPSPYDLAHALTLRSINDVAWSRDGARLAFVVTTVDTAEDANNQDVWLADLRHGTTRQLTRHPKNDFSPTFSPGGDTLAFVANRGTGEDAHSAIWMMDLRGGEPWAFGSDDEGIGEVRWSPDGRWLAYVKTDTLAKAIREWRKKKWDQVVEDERLQYPALWVAEVATGKRHRLTTGPNYLWNLRWAPDSRSIAFLWSPTGKPDDGNAQDVGVVPVAGGGIRKLGVAAGNFAWSPDGRWIAIEGTMDRKNFVDRQDLWLVPATGGRAVNLTASFDGNADLPSWSPRSDTLWFHAAHGVESALMAVPRTGGAVRMALERRADAGAMFASGDGRVAWVQSDALTPAELWVADRPGAAGRALSTLNAEVATLALASTREVRWTSDDGTRIEGLLVRPHGAAPGAALPTIVLLHGGPYADRYSLAFQGTPQFYAAHGYQVFMPNFRSSGGYGTAFMVRKRADWGGQDWRDVMTGVDSLVKRRLADPHRLAVTGGSYGGYLSAWAVTQTDRFRAACVFAGAVDLAAHYGQSDIHRYRAYDFQGTPWENPETWRRASPMTYVTRAKTPTLILVGESDPRVPAPQSREFYTALSTLGVPVEYVHYPREGHGLREPRHRADQLTRTLAWFDRWLKPR